MKKYINHIAGAIASIFIAQIAGILGAVATSTSVATWYPTLTKPWFTPPNWLFGPAWTALYTLMGISAYIVWTTTPTQGPRTRALVWYAIQLAVNAVWSPVFFGLRSVTGGLVIIIALWATIAVTIRYFYRVSSIAAALLVPYILWVSYALALNTGLWYLN